MENSWCRLLQEWESRGKFRILSTIYYYEGERQGGDIYLHVGYSVGLTVAICASPQIKLHETCICRASIEAVISHEAQGKVVGLLRLGWLWLGITSVHMSSSFSFRWTNRHNCESMVVLYMCSYFIYKFWFFSNFMYYISCIVLPQLSLLSLYLSALLPSEYFSYICSFRFV